MANGQGLKDDQVARRMWGSAYNDIPKSVFALAAWHLANIASEDPDGEGQAEARFREEIEALASNKLITPAQAKRVLATLTAAAQS